MLGILQYITVLPAKHSVEDPLITFYKNLLLNPVTTTLLAPNAPVHLQKWSLSAPILSCMINIISYYVSTHLIHMYKYVSYCF